MLLQIAPAAGEDRIHLMSATKSVVALTIGLLLDDGKLASIDEPVSTVYPEWRQGRKRDITIRMLMDHTSGLQNVANAGVELEGAPDLVKLALAAEVSSDPGTTFAYNNKATNLLPDIVQRLAGKPLDVYLDERLFKLLGITGHAWMKDQAGTPMGMAGLSLSAVDLAAIGRLMLDGGVTPDGKRLLSERSVALMTAESARSPDVGLLWWRIPAWEHYRLKAGAATLLSARSMDAVMLDALLAADGQVFDSKSALISFLAERLGPSWPQRYAAEITGRGLKLGDIFDVDRGPVAAYAANGYLGQHLVIVPDKGVVAVRQIQRRESHSAPLDDYAAFPMDVLRLAETL
ncbi:serine hydrolase domain-containing protein [Stenotrophomonas indicatrix]|uniref:serine hydrolase domain-containing protein n=1 Tax=Stenotrophomonas indicatrix TaxID=2045451 RepID=UPI00289A71C4|nr:serine hydrolase domain-containing protein [Stenotrophomonas indicatrix]